MSFTPIKKNQLEAYKAGRFTLVKVMVSLVATVLFARGLSLHLVEGDFLRGEGQKRFLRTEKIAAYRGMILDRNGKALAVSTPTLSLWANPKQLQLNPSAWPLLADALNISASHLASQLHRFRDKEFMFLKRQLSPEAGQRVLDLGISGVYKTDEYRRFYPAGEVVSQLVGITNIDEQGQEGMELAYNEWLSGQQGERLVVKDLLGHRVKDLGTRQAAKDGQDLTLSVDLRVQFRGYQVLEQAVTEHQAQSASLVAMDINTGELLAVVNYPGINPNDRRLLKLDHLRNRAFTDLFEPGSTIKPFTVAMGMESGEYSAHTQIDTQPGSLRVGRKLIKDHRNYGEISLTQVITKSSNVGASKIALSLDADRLPELLSRFGFGQYLQTGFPGESLGYLPADELNHPIEIATLSYGYGLSTTLLHLTQAYATLGRHGVYKPVRLLAGSGAVDAPIRVMSEDLAKTILQMMETVVGPEGTALRAAVEGYRVAGKTGTTHKLSKQGYLKDRYVSLFVGVAPVSRPKWVVAVIVDDPSSDAYFGGEVAAPAFSEVMGTLFRLYGTPPDQPSHEANQTVSLTPGVGGSG